MRTQLYLLAVCGLAAVSARGFLKQSSDIDTMFNLYIAR